MNIEDIYTDYKKYIHDNKLLTEFLIQLIPYSNDNTDNFLNSPSSSGKSVKQKLIYRFSNFNYFHLAGEFGHHKPKHIQKDLRKIPAV